MKKLSVIGAGGHAKVVIDVARKAGLEPAVVYDAAPRCDQFCGVKVLPEPGDAAGVRGPLFIAVGSNAARRNLATKYSASGFPVLVHPSAVVAGSAEIGEGTVVMAGAVVQPEAVVGRHCIINTGASVDHDCRIADFVHVSPHATLCGGVSVGEGSWIGAGATVIQCVRIGAGCMIGAGATVVCDIPDGATALGTPARVVNKEL